MCYFGKRLCVLSVFMMSFHSETHWFTLRKTPELTRVVRTGFSRQGCGFQQPSWSSAAVLQHRCGNGCQNRFSGSTSSPGPRSVPSTNRMEIHWRHTTRGERWTPASHPPALCCAHPFPTPQSSHTDSTLTTKSKTRQLGQVRKDAKRKTSLDFPIKKKKSLWRILASKRYTATYASFNPGETGP